LKPEGWGRAAIRAAVDFDADCIVVETNFGGDMAVSTLITASEEIGVSIPVRTVHASRGKHPRAEPVSMLAQQGRWYFGGNFDELETQLCTWTADSDYSPDRLDAMVWPAWYLKLVSTLFSASGSFGGSQMSKRVLSGSRRAGLTIVTNQSEVPHEGDQESSG
jgi:phage terminase large subunit-like protein